MKDKLLMEYFKNCAYAALKNVMIIGQPVGVEEWYKRTIDYLHEDIRHELDPTKFRYTIALQLVYFGQVATSMHGYYIPQDKGEK